MKYDTRLCWLPFLGDTVKAGFTTCREMAEAELAIGLRNLGYEPPVCVLETPGEDEGYEIQETPGGLTIRGGTRGVLYGAYSLMMRLAAGQSPLTAWTAPCRSLRMLNHWDNMSGAVERGYAGRSLFFDNGKFAYDSRRLLRYGRILASVGINTVCINNVNVETPADQLITDELLPEVRKVADLLRPFGIRLLIAIDFALPMTCGLTTADPLDGSVRGWWEKQVARVYAAIPDLCGFLVKADSEFRPGPGLYCRNHAEGARPIARALAAFGGTLVWRCFVYNCQQDWRDRQTDRPKAAYETYAPLEGLFDENVILQVKYGPYDFQVREPISPLLYAMPATKKALEVQLTQEYTGHQIDLYYMLPQWQEILSDLKGAEPRYISAVSNLGNDANWTGHDLAQANLFAYGLFAWYAVVDTAAVTRWWIALTFGEDPRVEDVLLDMLLASRELYESYTAPLGLGWMVNPNGHYGPSPEGYEYSAWGTYLRADRQGIGVDRSPSGTGFVLQYPPDKAALYGDVKTCPEELILFFHRLSYTHTLPSGKTLAQHVYDTHFEGARRAEAMAERWNALEGRVPAEAFDNVRARFILQARNAREWRDVVNAYFYRYSGVADEKGRVLY
ncbi:MAG: alpha-glucuronidase [Firmicutes bacterium]|nr:alpha-glucuronidase [Bacillota bacterium]